MFGMHLLKDNMMISKIRKIKLKRFKALVKKTKAITITAIPVHGKHAKGRNTIKESNHNSLSNHYKKHSDENLNMHVFNYSLDSTGVNNALIEDNKDSMSYHEHKIRGLDDYLNKAPPLHEDTHVYHGLNGWHPGMESYKHPDRHIHLPAYTSTSLDQDQAKEFSEVGTSGKGNATHSLHIHLKKDQSPGAYVALISANQHEKEFLMKRGSKLKIEPKPTIIKHRDGKGRVGDHDAHHYVWKAHYLEE